MKKNVTTIILTIILILGIGLRFWHLGTVPLSPDWDEVALGYDSYSIMHTGRDEFGTFMPAVLRSFDDYKPALYSYLAVPSIVAFGLTTFAVRFPSAVMGVVGILAIYFLVVELFESYKNKNVLALISAFTLAVSPWSIQFSRTAFETNTGLTFNLLIGLFFLKGLKRPWMMLLAAFFAGANLAVYQSERVFTPLLVLSLIIIYRKELFALAKKYLIASVVICLLAVLPTLLFIFQNPASLQRIQGTSITSQRTQSVSMTIYNLKDDKDNNDLIGQIIDNRRIIFVKEIIAGYLVHFDPNWLFLEGDNARHHAPGMGLFYLFDLPFLFIGLFQLLFSHVSRKTKLLIFSWLLLAPVPAAITFEVPHAVRTMNMLPALLIFISFGYLTVFQFIKAFPGLKKYTMVRQVVFAIIVLFALGNFFYYLNQYFVQQNYYNAIDWQYGYEQAIPQVEQVKSQYEKIVVSDDMPMDKSYMFFLFYLRYPPQQYQQLVAQGQNLVTNNHHFDNYEFRPFNWSTETIKPNVLYVGVPNDFPKSIKAKKTIYYPDGSPAILFVDPKDN